MTINVNVLRSFYELNIIPSIVLASLMGLGWFAGEGDVSILKVAQAFVSFIFYMAVEDLLVAIKCR